MASHIDMDPRGDSDHEHKAMKFQSRDVQELSFSLDVWAVKHWLKVLMKKVEMRGCEMLFPDRRE